MDNFSKTVNLKDSLEQKRRVLREGAVSARAKQETAPKTKTQSRAEGIDRVYKSGSDEDIKSDLQKISQPAVRSGSGNIYKSMTMILAAVIVIMGAVLFLTKDDGNGNGDVAGANESAGSGWYSTKLMNGEVYYGQIDDLSSDPVIIRNVYYNYDQLNQEEGEEKKGDTANLRLVKRGKETHGPDGSMSLVRTQIVYMEPLKNDSKVLKAILDYEK
ncbi:hypothetical protein A2303_05440 [Candidatus Falkowbacteria bacterium RIFOXYB2_FULL_47_14]|uniref:Uncharacterized protein n=1 Tax=Candidatus Falkowbacteria bacterium RIFOXYA2_FULL_47_19 TaxID=1797994 RepID=A0A1F5SJM6_9BACT|nr:MAG: hypothetical protein A2227_07700 [Candidatus Falkowbacteria bacterium RIFOXYA2_FULL_47_19]OGF36164.1 MAG: hypothetical protein A2468_06550 [Candidatus Falkowbacteria bacterium RIFOXYC2_FULL_46_15]OGF43374.1 MAG: hypothetical protein A2303_05440 [Candidatus Falkowbacteria bacterium RIFOXYB2_FULL_47_14]